MIEDLSTTLPLSVLVNQRHQKPDSSRPPASGNGLWAGPFRGVRRGQGTDFDDLRHYTAGDEVRHVDWKVSARRNALHTRLYREEKEHLSTFVCDLRSAMFTGSKTLTSVTTGHLIASLIWHAIDSGGRVSLMLITDSDIKSTRSASGHKSAIAACGLLASTFAKVRRDCLSSSYANQSELNELNDNQLSRTIDELLSLGRRAGTVVLASNFSDVDDELSKKLTMLSLSRPTAAIHVEDPMCFDGLPPGRYRYVAADNSNSSSGTVHLRGRDKKRLLALLDMQHSHIIEQFEKAQISLLDGRIGPTMIKTELRQLGFLL